MATPTPDDAWEQLVAGYLGQRWNKQVAISDLELRDTQTGGFLSLQREHLRRDLAVTVLPQLMDGRAHLVRARETSHQEAWHRRTLLTVEVEAVTFPVTVLEVGRRALAILQSARATAHATLHKLLDEAEDQCGRNPEALAMLGWIREEMDRIKGQTSS